MDPYPRDLIEACQEGELADLLGSPPSGIGQREALSCQPCPDGKGMDRDGFCRNCPADEVVTWNGTSCGDQQELLFSSAPDDFCPDRFVVEIHGGASSTPVTDVTVSVADPLLGAFECRASRLTGTISAGADLASLAELASFDSQGVPCEPAPGDDICLDTCVYPTAFTDGELEEDVQVSVSANMIRVVAESLGHGVNVVVKNDPPAGCGPIVK